MRTRVSPRRLWRITSWPAACGIRWVKPSIATVSPSRSDASIASARERNCAIVGLPALHVEEDRLVRSLHVDVEAIDGAARRLVALRDQRMAAVGWHPCKHRVCGIRLSLVGEIDARVEVRDQAAHEHDEVEVRCLAVADGAGLDRVEHEAALRV